MIRATAGQSHLALPPRDTAQMVERAEWSPALVSEAIRKIAFGSVSGQVVLTLIKLTGAASYELRWASAAPGTANPTAWSSQPVANTKQPVTISTLIPGTIYVFQARAVTATGYSDWSQPVTKMVI